MEVDRAPSYVSAETSQRIACDASVVVTQHRPDEAVVDAGRKIRTIPSAIRRALAARDHGCQFPGCTARRCDGHHIRHWADGGPTRLDNLILLCRRHHRAVHEEGFRVVRTEDGTAIFFRPDGGRLEVGPRGRDTFRRTGRSPGHQSSSASVGRHGSGTHLSVLSVRIRRRTTRVDTRQQNTMTCGNWASITPWLPSHSGRSGLSLSNLHRDVRTIPFLSPSRLISRYGLT